MTEPVKLADEHAKMSLRAVAGLEVASIITSVLLTTWVIIPLQPRQRWLVAVPAILALALMIHSHRVRGERLSQIGFTSRHFGSALLLAGLPTLMACVLFATIGYFTHSFHLTSHFWANLVFLPIWGLTQQYALQGFIYRRVRFVLWDENALANRQRWQIHLATVVTATIFALAHAPNLMLMLLTLVGALFWSWVYERAPNLWVLGLSHAAISLTLMTCLPAWVLPSLSVGYKHFLYQKF